MTTGESRAVLSAGIILVALGALFYYSRQQSISAIQTFADCRAAGYPIMESYPERCSTPDGRVFFNEAATSTPSGQNSTSTPPTSTPQGHPNIRVDNVTENQIVTSPLTITGSARKWYFEASFPVELVDANGKRLAVGPAQTQGDWMTTAFVPFSVTLTFPKPDTATGVLIFRNDNPSGLPELQEEYRIPVRFSTAERTVNLFYYNPTNDKDAGGNILCSSRGLVPVQRNIPVTQTPLQDSVRLLLRGEITQAERTRGITSEFPLSGLTLTGASLSSNGALTISLSDPQGKTTGGSCRVQVLRAQIEATAKQFPSVTSVTFSPSTLFQP